MSPAHPRDTIEWLSSPENPPVRYLTARSLIEPTPSPSTLGRLRREAVAWPALGEVLALQLEDGRFPYNQKTPTAQPTMDALVLMQRCGMDTTDGPVRRAIDYLDQHHRARGALSYTTGGSGVLPCYSGVITTALIKLGGLASDLVQDTLQWLVDHARFDHKDTLAGGDQIWPFKAPQNYGCWDSVSCYHGVAGAFRALAAVPPPARTPQVEGRLAEALEYLRIHRLHRRTGDNRPLFRHMTRFFLVGGYRSHLLDLLEALADADPGLGHEHWVRAAVAELDELTEDSRVPLVMNYGRKLADPIPLERVGEPSRFLTYQWLSARRRLKTTA